MAQPSSREGLIDYAKRQLGFPVLEINVADEQFQDLLDDSIQIYQERHYDGIARMYLKYKITQDDIDRVTFPSVSPSVTPKVFAVPIADFFILLLPV